MRCPEQFINKYGQPYLISFYQTVADLYRGNRDPTHADARTIKDSISNATDCQRTLEGIAALAGISPIKAEGALYSAVFQAAPYACTPKTQTSAKKWLELQPSSPLSEHWTKLTTYKNEKDCCGGCSLVKKIA